MLPKESWNEMKLVGEHTMMPPQLSPTPVTSSAASLLASQSHPNSITAAAISLVSQCSST